MTHQDTGSITLVELDEPSYRKYRETLVRDYAADKARAKIPTDATSSAMDR